jgi:hypothetical protein
MSRRRWILVLSLLAFLLIGAEVTLRRWQSPKACIQIINDGDGVMEDLVLDYADTKIPVGRLGMKLSTHVWVTAGPKGPLRLDFRQKGNALKGFQIPEYDPQQNLQDFFKMVLVVKSNEIQRFVEDDEFRKKPESLGDRVKQWLSSEFEPEK